MYGVPESPFIDLGIDRGFYADYVPGLGSGFNTGYSFENAVAEQPQAVQTHRSKPIVVTGASGFVGSHLCAELAKAGWQIRAIVRDSQQAAIRLAHLPVELRNGDIRDPESMRSAMEGAWAVVHLAAIAIEREGQTYEQINAEATKIVLSAARAARVQRFVHMSQNGSDSQSPFPFLRSKGVAQDAVTESTLSWTVLRPSVIFGPEDEFVNVLARLVRLSPGIFPLPGGGSARFQPIHVDDVAQAIRFVLDEDATIHGIFPLGGPAVLTLRQMAERILLAMHTRRMLVPLPLAIARPLIGLMQRVLPHPPVTTGLLDLLALDNTVPNNAMMDTFGFTPIPFAPEELGYLRRITAKNALQSLFQGH